MKKVILCVLATFITLTVTASAIALCPFTYRVNLSGAKVLAQPKPINRNPQNPYITATYGNEFYHENYFEISQTTCGEDYRQSTEFQVIVGSQASPPNRDGSLNLSPQRPGRNCILTVIAGSDQNLELEHGILGGVNCTNNIQLDLSEGTDKYKYRENPLRLSNSGEGDHTAWTPHFWPPLIGLGDTKHEIDTYYYYNPHFSTP